MSMSDEPQVAEEHALGDLLRAAGRRPQPSDEQLARWHAGFERQLERAQRRRRTVRVLSAGVAAAAAAVVALVFLPGGPPALPATPVAEVLTARGGIVIRHDDGVTSLAVGDAVRAGERVESGRASRLAVAYAGADVRLDESTAVVFREGALELLQGRLYVDTGAGGNAAAGLRVDTPAGRFTHLGTQFLIGVTDGEVIGAVREGSIALRTGAGELVLDAGGTAARMVVIAGDGGLRESSVAANGALWSWVEAASPGLVLAGRSAHEVLSWVARERGLRLDYASAGARRAADAARLAGSGERLEPGAVLDVIAAATLLDVEITADAGLTVSLRSEGHQHAQ